MGILNRNKREIQNPEKASVFDNLMNAFRRKNDELLRRDEQTQETLDTMDADYVPASSNEEIHSKRSDYGIGAEERNGEGVFGDKAYEIAQLDNPQRYDYWKIKIHSNAQQLQTSEARLERLNLPDYKVTPNMIGYENPGSIATCCCVGFDKCRNTQERDQISVRSSGED